MKASASKKASRLWDDIWRGDRYSSKTIRTKRAALRLRVLRKMGLRIGGDDHVLEVGCGDGSLLARLKDQSNSDAVFVGCDFSGVAIHRARSETGFAPLVLCDAHALPFKAETFTKVLTFGMIEHVADPEQVLIELRRVSRPASNLFFSVSSKRSAVYLMRRIREKLGVWPYGYQRNYSPTELRNVLGRLFRIRYLVIVQAQLDFPVSAVFDRILAVIVSAWGRYIFALCDR